MFKVISLQFFTMFPVLRSFLGTVFQILNRKFFFTDEIMSSMSGNPFLSALSLSFGNRQSQLKPSQESTATETTALASQWPAHQWAGWKAVFSTWSCKWLGMQQWLQQQRKVF
jgi:hypothetical protein